MSNLEIYTRFSWVSSLVFGAIVAGVGFAAFAPRRAWSRAAVLIAAACGSVALGALMIPDSLTLVSLVAFGTSTFVFLVGFESVRMAAGRLYRAASRPRVAGGLALALGLAIWGLESWNYDRTSDRLMEEELQSAAVVGQAPVAESAHHAYTDRGTPIQLSEATDPLDTSAARLQESSSTALLAHAGEFIRRAPADDHANCHGWTFAAGRYHILGTQVEKILVENEYRQVAQPQPGDVCIYRDNQHAIAHSGIVRAVVDSHTVILESKWGRLGVYLHDTDETSYGTDYSYFRSTRAGHLLHGVESTATPGTNAAHSDGD